MSDEETTQLQSTTWTLFNLCLNLGLISSVIGQYPEHVQEGFTERLIMIDRWAEEQIEEAQSFGEAYDDQTEEADEA
jgi:hypothetical protein